MVLTLHNPQSRNAMDTGVYAAGVEALNAAGDNHDIRSVVVAGSGNTFSAGPDLQLLRDNRSKPRELQADSLDAFHLFIETVNTFPKPVIAAVEGVASGAGFSLALACDMIIAARDAVFLMPDGGIGFAPDGGAIWHLARSLPRATAIEIALLGAELPAERLHALGVVNRLSSQGFALRDALSLAEALNRRAANVVEATKEMLGAALQTTLSDHLAAGREQFLRSLEHGNSGIGVEAFANKQSAGLN